ncbi:hypothetical protein [Oryza sativa Japonica Group]|uniref:Uncharacterized protein P0702B09.12 n=1 Tax=Oryza sativa subsp. japonica TaxID=39947 RepID=Q5VR62_ORYSJ|nr:hypothetical protein [Oryza sativa Japonica Group]
MALRFSSAGAPYPPRAMLWRSVGPRAAPSSSASYLNDLGSDGRWGTKKTSATVAFERDGREEGAATVRSCEWRLRWISPMWTRRQRLKMEESGVVQHRQVAVVGDDDLSYIKVVDVTVLGGVALTGVSLPSGCRDCARLRRG